MRHSRALRVCTLTLLLLDAGCGVNDDQATDGSAATPVALSPDNIAIAERSSIETGPRLSGTLEPERQSSVRAEIGGTLMSISAERGQRVAQAAQLGRIEDQAARDAMLSAQSAVRSAEVAFRTAEREAERTERLVAGGALAERDLEVANTNLASSRAQFDDARARLASAREQLGHTQLVAPIAGIVSERPVNAGDVVNVGDLLFTIVDPTSMQLEAAVPADAIGTIGIGTAVEFQVRGYPGRTFAGRIDRISPAADPVTRQIPIFVSIPNAEGQLVAGLFADGRVAAQSRATVVVPTSAVQEDGPAASVLRLRAGRAAEVQVQVGIRDQHNDRVEIIAGLAIGDTVLTGAARGITPGSIITVRRESNR